MWSAGHGQLRDGAGRAHILAKREAGFEDGTLNYLSIPAVAIGLRHLERVGIDVIRQRVDCLTAWLLGQLLDLRHSNGRHMVRIYGPATMAMRGGTVTLNFYDPAGHLLDYRRVEELASEQRISLRTGCFCNPGAGETAEGVTEDDVRAAIEEGDMTLPRFLQVIQHRGGKSAGAIRVSLGIASNFADVDRFVQFATSLRDQTRLTMGDVTFDVSNPAALFATEGMKRRHWKTPQFTAGNLSAHRCVVADTAAPTCGRRRPKRVDCPAGDAVRRRTARAVTPPKVLSRRLVPGDPRVV
jgi:hypothetical protein